MHEGVTTASPYLPSLIVEGRWNWRASKRKDTIRNPWNAEIVATVPVVAPDDARSALDWASTRTHECAEWPLENRIRAINYWADRLLENRESIAQLETLEMGKPIRQSRAIVDGVVKRLRLFAFEAATARGHVIPTESTRSLTDKHVFSFREPLGLVAGILPFNSPVSALAWKVAPALLMGNAIVVKPSSQAPVAAIAAAQLLQGAELPNAALQVLNGSGAELGRVLTDHPAVRKISFTGGTDAGREVWRASAPTMKRLGLECSSCDPALILNDANLALAARAVVDFGVRRYSGQLCTAPKRCIVDKEIYPEFLDALLAETDRVVQGDPMDDVTELGPLVNEAAAREVEEQIAQGVDSGATLLCGGKRTGAAFMPPTVLSGVDVSNPLFRDVPFGPVIVVMKAADDVEAVRLANDSDFGLRAAVFSEDVRRAVRIARFLDFGGVTINGPASVAADPFLTVEPRKQSGVGSEGVLASLNEFSQSKFVWINEWWSPTS